MRSVRREQRTKFSRSTLRHVTFEQNIGTKHRDKDRRTRVEGFSMSFSTTNSEYPSQLHPIIPSTVNKSINSKPKAPNSSNPSPRNVKPPASHSTSPSIHSKKQEKCARCRQCLQPGRVRNAGTDMLNAQCRPVGKALPSMRV